MKKDAPRTSELVSPNLIPMIDIMFLLLLFFMLGADMGHRELEDVSLPKADNANVPPHGTDLGTLTINAYHTGHNCDVYNHRQTCRTTGHWQIAIKGKDVTEPAALALALQTETSATRHVDAAGRSISDRKVMIRSDASAPYGLAQRAMNVCAEQGIYRIEVGAAKPAQR
jgi:biopolymer transport protein ExbD